MKIPFVKYHATEDVNTELLRYKTGDMDITYDIPIEQFATLKAELPGEVWVYPTAYVTFFSFRPSHPDLANIDIRRALTLALDRDLLENKIVRSGAMPTFSLAGGIDPEYMGPTIAEASMTQDEREALAQELYAKAGYGPDNPLRLTMTLSAAEISLRRAQGAALMWKQVLGAEIDIKSMEGSAANETYYAKDWVMYVDNLISDYAGPEPLLAAMRPSPDNVYEWDKPEFNALMDEAVALTAKEDRLAALAKAERVLLDDYIIAPLAIEPSRRLVKPNVKGFAASPVLYHHSQWMTLE